MVDEIVSARGHEHVRAAHGSTLEVTTDDWLTPAGDCIVGVTADRAPADLGDAFVAACRGGAAVTVELSSPAVDATTRIEARGHPELTFASERSLVVRTSEHVDDRTVAVGADTPAAGVDRDLVDALADGAALRVRLRADGDTTA